MVIGVRFREEQFSLRLGHARVLTPHRGVIHYARAASLPPLQGLCVFSLCCGRSLFSGRRGAVLYRVYAFFVGKKTLLYARNNSTTTPRQSQTAGLTRSARHQPDAERGCSALRNRMCFQRRTSAMGAVTKQRRMKPK